MDYCLFRHFASSTSDPLVVYQFRHSVQSEEEKRILKQKKPSESMDNDITKTDYKQLTFRPTFPDKLSDKLDHCICPQTCHTLGGGTPLCKTCTVVCCPKGYGFYAFSCLTTGIDFAHLGLEWGIVSEGLSYYSFQCQIIRKLEEMDLKKYFLFASNLIISPPKAGLGFGSKVLQQVWKSKIGS